MQAEIISPTTPTNCYTGRIWIEPLAGITNVWIKLGTGRELIAQTLIPYNLFNSTKDRLFVIDGLDKTEYIEANTLMINKILDEADTCDFGVIGFKPLVGQEVEVYDKISGSFVKRYGGEIIGVTQERTGKAQYGYDVTCNDYSESGKKKLVAETYTNMYAGEIIKDLVNNYAEEIGTYFVDYGNLLPKYQFNYMYPFDCIAELAELQGWGWYVDVDRNIHFTSKTSTVAPHTLTDNLADSEYSDLTIRPDKTQLKNKVIVRGGYYLSEVYTQERIADGTQVSFQLDYEAYTPIEVSVDVGAGYVLHTLGIDNIDDAGKDFVYNFNEKVIKNLDHAVLSAGNKIKITYTYKIPVLVEQSRQDSIDAMKLYEGGDGIYEYLIVDENIQSKATALKRAVAELDTYGNPLVEGSFVTTQMGYEPGQLLTINIPSRGINEQYLIQQVNATAISMDTYEFEVIFATTLLGLHRFLMGLLDATKSAYDRGDEILSKLGYITDSFTLSDSIASTEIRVPSTRPYTYGVDADSGRYSLASYA
jgi:hypothetical protein